MQLTSRSLGHTPTRAKDERLKLFLSMKKTPSKNRKTLISHKKCQKCVIYFLGSVVMFNVVSSRQDAWISINIRKD